jgi:(2Fe-2S) ferredoxin
MCARSTCLFPCNLGPVMVVHPDGAWYGGLTRERLDQIVSEHLLLDRSVQEAIVHVTPGHADP